MTKSDKTSTAKELKADIFVKRSDHQMFTSATKLIRLKFLNKKSSLQLNSKVKLRLGNKTKTEKSGQGGAATQKKIKNAKFHWSIKKDCSIRAFEASTFQSDVIELKKIQK